MSATLEQAVEEVEQPAGASLPELAVPNAERAISIVNRWLHSDVAFFIHVSRAIFNSKTYCWHLPVELAYPTTGPLGVIGDVYLHAATGQFVGRPGVGELQQRAIALAEAHGFTEDSEEDSEENEK
ncbi:MAG: hypothetical protein ACREAB_01050 [Blastocatellia bacterium]